MLETTRRHIIRTTVLDFICCCAAAPAMAAEAVRANGTGPLRLNWDAFVERLELEARQQRRPHWNQIQYVQSVASMALTLDVNAKQLSSNRIRNRTERRPHPEFTDLLRTLDVRVTLIDFERGENIPHHDHPDMTGVTVCTTGSVQVADYDIVGVPAPSGWLLKKGEQQELMPGRVATLTSRSEMSIQFALECGVKSSTFLLRRTTKTGRIERAGSRSNRIP